jgi:hypothetical protein
MEESSLLCMKTLSIISDPCNAHCTSYEADSSVSRKKGTGFLNLRSPSSINVKIRIIRSKTVAQLLSSARNEVHSLTFTFFHLQKLYQFSNGLYVRDSGHSQGTYKAVKEMFCSPSNLNL